MLPAQLGLGVTVSFDIRQLYERFFVLLFAYFLMDFLIVDFLYLDFLMLTYVRLLTIVFN